MASWAWSCGFHWPLQPTSSISALCGGIAMVPALFPASRWLPIPNPNQGRPYPAFSLPGRVPVQLVLWLVTFFITTTPPDPPVSALCVFVTPNRLSCFPRLCICTCCPLWLLLSRWADHPSSFLISWPEAISSETFLDHRGWDGSLDTTACPLSAEQARAAWRVWSWSLGM